MSGDAAGKTNVLVTGASGYVGRHTLEALIAHPAIGRIVAVDLERPRDEHEKLVDVEGDIRSLDLESLLFEHDIDSIVHLASILSQDPEREELARDVDVRGTERVLHAAVAADVPHIVVTTSGASYGYHADNPRWLRETDPVRGHERFAYARNKRLVEELLARHRAEHPGLRQLVFRPGTILGPGAHTPVTALFEKRAVLGVWGHPAPFVFIREKDVAALILEGILERRAGIYNLAGDGAVAPSEIARRLRKPYLPIPAPLLKLALSAAQRTGLSPHGPDAMNFLRYRPCLANDKLRRDFLYTPASSREAFEAFAASLSGANR